MVKIACISDTHGTLPPPEWFDDVDLLLHAGDVGPDSNVTTWIDTVLRPWVAKLKPEFIGTLGNHDFPEPWYHPKVQSFVDRFFSPWGLTEAAKGIKIWHSAYTPIFFDWAWMRSENELSTMYQDIPTDIDILLTHGPPTGGGYAKMQHGNDVGSKALDAWLRDHPIPYVVCGHIHEGWGQYTRDNGTQIVNCSFMDEYYTPMNRYQKITLGKGK